MPQKRYRVLWYVCTSVGLLAAVFLAPLHWTFLVLTFVIACGGPLSIEFFWDITHQNVANKTSAEIDTKPSIELKGRKRRTWFKEEHVFNSSTSTMWLATLIALMEPESSVMILIFGVSFTLTLYWIKRAFHVLGNTAR